MGVVLSAAGVAVRVAGAASPRWGAAVALPMFAHVAKPRAVGVADEATMWRAQRSTVRIPGLARSGVDVGVYEWGQGRDTVVLAHGWSGRASQFATLVRELVAEGCRVVAFDAPAHGDTPGRGTYLTDWTDILAAMASRHGRLRAVVGHSFGGLGALIAAADGLPVDRVITVAAPADPDRLLTQFQRMLGYGDRVTAALRVRFARRYFPDESDALSRRSALLRPLPPGVSLLAVHDEGDRMVPFGELSRIAGANAGAHTLVTHGFGHNRVLASDPFLDAVVEFVGESRAHVAANSSSAVAAA